MYIERRLLYQALEEKYGSKLLAYVTSDRQGYEAGIGQDVIDKFIDQLDKIGVVPKLTLYLYTRGGDTSVAWNIVNLLRLYCDELQVIIPHKAHSAGTLISIGANSIVMTKQATLSPIDPSVNNPLNPQIPLIPQKTFPVSVEAVKGYLAFAKEELAIKDDIALANIMVKLSETVHPLVLGQVYRTRTQIKMLAEKLLPNQVADSSKTKDIIAFLCSDSGGHDYTINRREAKEKLGLNIVKPDSATYNVIKSIYDDVSDELGFGKPFDPKEPSYCVRRVLLESLIGGSHYFETMGTRKNVQVPINPMNPGVMQQAIQDERIFEGWKYESNTVSNANMG